MAAGDEETNVQDLRGVLYAGTEGFGAYRSTDEGAPWMKASVGITNLLVWCLSTDPGGHVYAGTLGCGVFMSRDAAETWKPLNDGLPTRDIFCLGGDAKGFLY